MAPRKPGFAWETRNGHPDLPVAGVDEVGRGPLAGPVVAAAVILATRRKPKRLALLNDSKQLDRPTRETLFDAIMDSAIVGVGEASVEEIDRLNIFHASHLAMRRAIAALPDVPHHALIDGNLCPRDLPCASTPVVGGDAKCLSIAAASVIAKVTRDRAMYALAEEYPHYGWDSNVGYGTPVHRQAIREHGLTIHHRRRFTFVAQQLGLSLEETDDQPVIEEI
jgi:ribonuclease HII